MRRRGNISLKLVAQMLVKAGFDHIITVDLHSKESLGFFDCAIDNLRASPFLIQYVQECVSFKPSFILNSQADSLCVCENGVPFFQYVQFSKWLILCFPSKAKSSAVVVA